MGLSADWMQLRKESVNFTIGQSKLSEKEEKKRSDYPRALIFIIFIVL